MGEPVDPNYQPPPPFAAPEQRDPAQPQSYYQPYSQPNYQLYSQPNYQLYYRPWTPPPTNNRRKRIVAVAVVAALALAGLAVYAFASASSPERLAMPQSFGGYILEHDATSDQVKSSLTSSLSGLGGASGDVFDRASVGLYTADTDVTQKVLVLALPASAVGSGGSSADFASQLLQYMGSAVSAFPAGPRGGTVQCGETSMGALAESGCSWADDKTTGMIVSVHQGGVPLSPQELATVTIALRDKFH